MSTALCLSPPDFTLKTETDVWKEKRLVKLNEFLHFCDIFWSSQTAEAWESNWGRTDQIFITRLCEDHRNDSSVAKEHDGKWKVRKHSEINLQCFHVEELQVYQWSWRRTRIRFDSADEVQGAQNRDSTAAGRICQTTQFWCTETGN